MRSNTTVLLVALLATLLAMAVSANLYVDSSVVKEFIKFKRTYKKKYESMAEELNRMHIFEENLLVAKIAQAANPHATFGVTKFSDLTREEFKNTYANSAGYALDGQTLKMASKLSRNAADSSNNSSNISSIDWREKGVVSEVMDQGSCSSGYAFATIGNIEGQWALAGHNLPNLSEQMLVSCDIIDSGCGGGHAYYALRWIVDQNKGVVYDEESYPYESADGNVPQCTPGMHTIGALIQYLHLEVNLDEDDLAAWLVQQGPLAVRVDSHMFQYYTGGVMTNCDGSGHHHDVLLVGYDNNAEIPYWIVKNSWGKNWGEDGYIRIRKGTNECLIAGEITTATL